VDECRREFEVATKKIPKGAPKNAKETRVIVGNNALR
jgi:hypothetical protein